MTAVLVNGGAAAEVAVADRALQYGDGLFETIACQAGEPCWMSHHWQRLRQGCERLGIAFNDYGALEQEVRSLAAGPARCIVKVIVSRGVARARGYRPSGTECPTRIVSRHEWPEELAPERALRVALSAVRLGVNPALAGLKHLNRLEQVLAQQSRPGQVEEVLMCSSEGLLISGSMSNVFFVDERGVFTPALHGCGVAGVMRRIVLESADGSQTSAAIPISIRPVIPAELARVREVFVTNVRWGIRSVGWLDGRALDGDDVATRLRDRCRRRSAGT